MGVFKRGLLNVHIWFAHIIGGGGVKGRP